ncbi:hypothetical protein XENORESO_004729 [Xenotaenia resolanae]|uniref:Uncharacterized protein n=1 Tax=Xenotaenia resolanae TaxID=208358 RepID=A0ABV0VSJ9_9TELE
MSEVFAEMILSAARSLKSKESLNSASGFQRMSVGPKHRVSSFIKPAFQLRIITRSLQALHFKSEKGRSEAVGVKLEKRAHLCFSAGFSLEGFEMENILRLLLNDRNLRENDSVAERTCVYPASI